jgi:ferritin-like protein
MGLLGKRFATLDRPALVRELVRAYADEWHAHYNYQFTAHSLRGHHSPSTITLLEKKSAEAFERARQLAARILELDGRLPSKLGEIPEHASDKPFKLPRSLSDVDGVLRAVLDAERTSLRTYQGLYDRTHTKDAVTALMAQEFLAAAVHGEEELERLMGDRAGEMTGTNGRSKDS